MPLNGARVKTSSPDCHARIDSSRQVSVTLLDRHLIFRQGLESLFRQAPEVSLVGSLSKPEDVAVCFDRVDVDVLILELDFPGHDLLRLIRCWSKDFPGVSLLVLTGLEESLYGERAIRAGARGFLEKSCGMEKLFQALIKVREGTLAVSPMIEALLLSRFSGLRKEVPTLEIDLLSDRELLAFTLIGQGLSTAQIAISMKVSPKTVGSFKERIKDKLGILDSFQLAQYAARQVVAGTQSSADPSFDNSNNNGMA